jgi:hypothetical protein
LDLKAIPVRKVHRVHREQPDLKGHKGRQVLRAQQELRGHKGI